MDSIEEVMPEDKSGQFAYKKRRSCELLVAIGLHRAELEDDLVVGCSMDQVKAFDSCLLYTSDAADE